MNIFSAYSDEILIVSYVLIIFILSYFLTGLIRSYSLKHDVMDLPNERSLHHTPIPRGGGLSITLATIGSILILILINWLPLKLGIIILLGCTLVSVVGWLDDHHDMPIFWRVLFYMVAALIVVIPLGGMEFIEIGESRYFLGGIGSIFAVLGIFWLTNLYNFMDGADGFASSEAITTGIFAGFLFLINNQNALAVICFVIAASCSGFLIWNWAPAKIFMGDVSSCFIGYMFGILAFIGGKTGEVNIYIWMILLAVFIWDATLTLFKRFAKREKWYSAHKSHSYQRLVQLGYSHSKLALALIVINTMILWPAAYIAYRWNELSFFISIISAVFIMILWILIQFSYERKLGKVNGGIM